MYKQLIMIACMNTEHNTWNTINRMAENKYWLQATFDVLYQEVYEREDLFESM